MLKKEETRTHLPFGVFGSEEEKIAGALLSRAVQEASDENGYGYKLCQVYPDLKTTRYIICVETKREPENLQAFAEVLDQALCEKIAIYKVERFEEMMLKPCEVRLMKAGWADHLTEKAAKGRASSAQVKVPVVIKAMPEDEWMK